MSIQRIYQSPDDEYRMARSDRKIIREIWKEWEYTGPHFHEPGKDYGNRYFGRHKWRSFGICGTSVTFWSDGYVVCIEANFTKSPVMLHLSYRPFKKVMGKR